MKIEKFDVVILGGGNAAMGVTVPTRAAGLSVAMIEARDLGGTCPNRGCTPKKVLVAAGHSLHEIERAKIHCISVGEPKIDWAALIDREKVMISGIPASLGRLMESRRVEVVKGQGNFAGPNAVSVAERAIEAEHIVIATGSRPRSLPIPGAKHMITSDEVLSERELPSEVVFVGGGVIAFELGNVYARAGSRVTILEVLSRPLAGFDSDAVDRIREESERIGIKVRTETKVRQIEAHRGRFRLVYERQGNEYAVECDRVVNGAGRVANIDGLDLARGNIAHQDGRIAIDDHLRSTSNSQVHLCGDVLWTSPQLSPVATYEGQLVGRNIVNGPREIPDYSSIPSCVYTVPALASVGLSEQAAREKNLKFTAHANDMLDWFSARTFAEAVAWSKILVEDTSDRILGAHIVGHCGEELIHTFAFAIKFGITATQIRETVFGFPTFSSDIRSML